MHEPTEEGALVVADKTPLEQLVEDAASALTQLTDFTIETEEQYLWAVDFGRWIATLKKRGESHRKLEVEPHNQAVAIINESYRQPADTLKSAEAKLAEAVTDYKRRAEEERQRLQAIEDERRTRELKEAEDLRQQQLAEAAELEAVAEATGDAELAETAQDLRVAADIPPPALMAGPRYVPAPAKASGDISRTDWQVTPTDPVEFGLPGIFAALDSTLRYLGRFQSEDAKKLEAEIRAAIAAAVPVRYLKLDIRKTDLKSTASRTKGKERVPGITFKEVAKTGFRSY